MRSIKSDDDNRSTRTDFVSNNIYVTRMDQLYISNIIII